jgi:hypothetical protein
MPWHAAAPSLARRVQEEDTRYRHIHENDQFDEARLAAWVKQASQLPGKRMLNERCEALRRIDQSQEFGDGIMWPIDFDMAMEHLHHPKGGPYADHDVERVPAVQILRRHRQCAGVWG